MASGIYIHSSLLNLRNRYKIHTLVINGAECEPYLTCDDRLMRERPSVTAVHLRSAALRGVMEKLVGIDRRRPLPLLARERFSDWFANR